MSLVSHELPHKLPQDLSRSSLLNNETSSGVKPTGEDILPADAVELRLATSFNPSPKKVHVNEYKDAVGKDSAFVKDTLRNKLAEVGMNPEMKLEISKDLFGSFQAKGNGMPHAMEQVNTDLNNNKAFRDAFNRLSTDQPTLNYVDNVVKVANAYGVANNVFTSLVSSTSDNNGLSDIAHRYDTLKANVVNTQDIDPFMADEFNNEDYRFVLNG